MLDKVCEIVKDYNGYLVVYVTNEQIEILDEGLEKDVAVEKCDEYQKSLSHIH